jgi:copper chaperone CopZ
MNISEFKKLIKECILEVKVKQSVKSLIKESLKDVKIEKG